MDSSLASVGSAVVYALRGAALIAHPSPGTAAGFLEASLARLRGIGLV